MNDNKARIANSVKHGINRYGLLPCRKDKCFYAEVCNVSDQLRSYDYGSPCPIEAIRAQEMADSFRADLFSVESDDKNAFIWDLIITSLQRQRVENTLAISGTMFNREDRNAYPILPDVLIRYYREISARNTKLLLQAKELKQQLILKANETAIADNKVVKNLDSKKLSRIN